MLRGACLVAAAAVALPSPAARAQSTAAGPQFDVVSIKRHVDGTGGSMRTLPDGTFMMVNGSIRSIILAASPVPAREVEGLPDWATRELYDVTAKPPVDATPQQRGAMMRNMFIERMKLEGHIEERERNTFALVLARSDERLGPELKPSELSCGTPPAAPTPPPDASANPQARCGAAFSNGSIVAGGITMDNLSRSLGGFAGGLVTNRTALQGFYAFTLRFAPRGASRPLDAPVDDQPEIFTALQEQLGLKLQAERTKVPVFVVDHIERPTEN